jgi:hypothetical protein
MAARPLRVQQLRGERLYRLCVFGGVAPQRAQPRDDADDVPVDGGGRVAEGN